MAVITQHPHSNDTRDDLAYSILLALGGTMADVTVRYNDTQKDLLYAILEKIAEGGGVGGGGGWVEVDIFESLGSDVPQTLEYAALEGATKVYVFMGGIYISDKTTQPRFITFTPPSTEITIPPSGPGEVVAIFKK